MKSEGANRRKRPARSGADLIVGNFPSRALTIELEGANHRIRGR